jgi:hypothetical protein
MKLNIIDQQGQHSKTGEKKKRGKTDLSKRGRKNEGKPSGDPQEEPIPPNTPRREYEEPGHEHEYQPPTANPLYQATPEFIGEG